jgi:hypothetical protein
LTEIISDNELPVPSEVIEEAELEEKKPVVEQVEIPEKSSDCAYHLGYLSERSSKEQIPDKCMMCKDIVTCMLKKMKV